MKKASRWSHGRVTVNREAGSYHVSIGGFHVCSLEDDEALDLLAVLKRALDVSLPGQRCEYCGINPPIGVDDHGRAYCGDCVVYACRLGEPMTLL